MLTIENFEKEINGAALAKGKNYFQANAVVDIEETTDNTWEAEVQGGEMYSVEVMLNNNKEITGYSCSCPVGGACKHVVAVFFVIREGMGKQGAGQRKAKTKDVFAQLLQRITLKEYQEFVGHHASKSKNFKTEFELWFAPKDSRIDVGKKYADMLKRIISKHTDRHGFVDYHSAFGLSSEVDKLITTGHELVKKQNFSAAFAIAKPVLVEMASLLEYSDDSNGNIGGAIDGAIRLIEKLISEQAMELALNRQIFDFLKTELDNSLYYDYGDFGYDLFSVFQKLAAKLNNADEFIGFIDHLVSKQKGSYSDYRRDFFNQQKIAFFKATGRSDESEKLVQQHLDIVGVRRGEVKQAISRNDLISAKTLILDGIKIARQKEHPGTVSEWEKELLNIAVLENDVETTRKYTRYFAFDRGFSKKYYDQWKNTYPTVEWKEVIEVHLSENVEKITKEHEKSKPNFFRPAHPPILDRLGPVYIEEHYWGRILSLVKKENNLGTALQYHQYLAKIFPAEMLEIYLPAIEYMGDKVNDRNGYADLTHKMKKIMLDIPEGKEKIMEIARILKARNPRRPAMIQELNKILQ